MLLELFVFVAGGHLPGHINPRMLFRILPGTFLPAVFEFRSVRRLIGVVQYRLGAKGILFRTRWC